jgi:hypothetical protein
MEDDKGIGFIKKIVRRFADNLYERRKLMEDI